MKHDILGEQIKNARLHKGISQEQLAEMLNCSSRHIMAIENEQKKPGYWLLYNLIRTLNIPADTIFYPERHNMPHKMDIAIDELVNMLYLCDEKTINAITAAVHELIKTK